MLPVGATAPDFELPGVDGRTGDFRQWSLGEFKGRPVVLLFYPGDGSPVCMRQLTEYTAGMGAFEDLDAQVLALSHQSPESHLAFAERNGGFGFPMLADEDKAVARDYGVLGLLDLYRRCTFVVDAEGIIAYSHRYVGPGLGYRPVEELVGAVAALAPPGRTNRGPHRPRRAVRTRERSGRYWATPRRRARVTERTPRWRLNAATSHATPPRIQPAVAPLPIRVPVDWL